MFTAVEDQEAILKDLLKTGKLTDFGKEHHFNDVQGHEQFIILVKMLALEKITHCLH